MFVLKTVDLDIVLNVSKRIWFNPGVVFTLVCPHMKLDSILRTRFMIEVIFWGRSPFHFLV